VARILEGDRATRLGRDATELLLSLEEDDEEVGVRWASVGPPGKVGGRGWASFRPKHR
jgi:hypothetical protein